MSSVPSATLTEQLRDVISSPLGILAMSCLVGYMAYMHVRRDYPTYDDDDYEKEGHVKIPTPLKNLKLSKSELQQYDSQNPDGRYLVALMGIVYDVSSAPQDFGPKGSYETLSGGDILWYVRNTARFESRDFDSYLNEWINMLEDHFYVAGVLLEDQKQLDLQDQQDQPPEHELEQALMLERKRVQNLAESDCLDYHDFQCHLQDGGDANKTLSQEHEDDEVTLVQDPNSSDSDPDATLTQSKVE